MCHDFYFLSQQAWIVRMFLSAGPSRKNAYFHSCDRWKYAFYELVRNTKEPASGTGTVLTGPGAAVDMGQLRGHRYSQIYSIQDI